MSQNKFKGPLFVVGMPRSGTKLFRDLLNQHPAINLPIAESHFIPHMLKLFGSEPQFEQPERFESFLAEFYKTPYYTNYSEFHSTINDSIENNLYKFDNWPDVFEYIFKTFALKEEIEIWGDKTPGYVRHIALLHSLYPHAKFLHIIRDPRDQSLSAQNAWGKSLVLNANIWRQTILNAREAAKELGESYFELFYEDLVENPAPIFEEVCAFLGIEFDKRMLYLEESTEFYGDAKGRLDIVSNNVRKYKDRMSPTQLRRIEEVVFPIDNVPYVPELAQKFRPLRKHEQYYLKLRNGWFATKFHVIDKGFFSGIDYVYRHYRQSSWRY